MERINVEELNKRVSNNIKIIAIFSAEWCGQCKMTKLLVEEVQNDFPNILFVEIDVDDNKLWDDETLKISQVPTFVGFKHKKVVFNISGYQTKDNFINLIKKL